MLPKKFQPEDLEGRLAVVEASDIVSRSGNTVIAKGAVVRIKNVAGLFGGITVETPKCPYCGQHAEVSRIRRHSLTLFEEAGTASDPAFRDARIKVLKLREVIDRSPVGSFEDLGRLLERIQAAESELRQSVAAISNKRGRSGSFKKLKTH